jgi:hypothetical protein
VAIASQIEPAELELRMDRAASVARVGTLQTMFLYSSLEAF